MGSAFLRVLTLISSLALPATAQALVIYSEPSQGDLPNAGPGPVLNPQLGENDLFGSVGGADLEDNFQFAVPGDTKVVRWDATFDGFGDATVTIWTTVWSFDSESFGTRDFITEVPTSGPGFTELLPGIYDVQVKSGLDPTYSFTIELVPLPEPGTGLLLLLGLGSLGLKRPRGYV